MKLKTALWKRRILTPLQL